MDLSKQAYTTSNLMRDSLSRRFVQRHAIMAPILCGTTAWLSQKIFEVAKANGLDEEGALVMSIHSILWTISWAIQPYTFATSFFFDFGRGELQWATNEVARLEKIKEGELHHDSPQRNVPKK
eukprot:TRINITY_DN6061_c0_g1_i2.p2 TRINITY_DN6061_c0_g1~~TRINITY_DN6061_c0_g1_i2.p2  ORF type:complete len:123 (+),score=23.34 TRINITY_DN6061_c0_g1_i2:394-762(+)